MTHFLPISTQNVQQCLLFYALKYIKGTRIYDNLKGNTNRILSPKINPFAAFSK